MHYPNHLLQLIQSLKKLPGVGSKSAERFAFELLEWEGQDLATLAMLLGSLKDRVQSCGQCGCLVAEKGCGLCDLNKRDSRLLCITASARDVFSIEQTREYKGLYHVLGGVLSPMDGRGPSHLRIDQLKERVMALQVQEIVIALDSTLEGDATALFLKRELAAICPAVSRLAFGLPMGSSLEYVDGGTLARALSGRRLF
jgi:recombination protein RecR